MKFANITVPANTDDPDNCPYVSDKGIKSVIAPNKIVTTSVLLWPSNLTGLIPLGPCR